MKRFLGLCACLTVLFFTACSDNDGPEPSHETEKTLFLYLPWSSTSQQPYQRSLFTYFINNINSIEQAIKQQGGIGNTRLVTFISLSPTYSALIETKYQNGYCVRDTLKRYYDYDYTTPSGIASLLTDVKTSAPAPTYAMVIGCHGNGWIPRDIKNYYRSRSFGGIDTQYQTELTSLAEGIKGAAMPMQFIAFDDCYMANIEVAYDLKDVTQYIIASTSEIMADGLPYSRIWSYLASATPNYQAIVNEFYNYYTQYTYPYGTLSVIDCSQIDAMASWMKGINSRYTFDATAISNLQKLDGMAQTIFFDMKSYIDNLCDDNDCNQFNALVARLVPYHVHTSSIYTDFSQYNGGVTTIPVTTFCGITISDPTTNTYVAGRKSMTGWWIATH